MSALCRGRLKGGNGRRNLSRRPEKNSGRRSQMENHDRAELDRLTPRVYDQLRRLAGHFMRNESPARTMQATALVHEAYLRLADVENVDWRERGRFFAVT